MLSSIHGDTCVDAQFKLSGGRWVKAVCVEWQVGASVSLDTRNQVEMQRWNEKYGEGGSRKKMGFGFAAGMDWDRCVHRALREGLRGRVKKKNTNWGLAQPCSEFETRNEMWEEIDAEINNVHSFATIANVNFGIESPSSIENVKCLTFAIVLVCSKCWFPTSLISPLSAAIHPTDFNSFRGVESSERNTFFELRKVQGSYSAMTGNDLWS